MPIVAKAIRFERPGGPEVLRLETLELGAPGPGEVQLKHSAIGVNFVDTYHRSGLYPVKRLPSGIGLEAVGVVEKVGPDVDTPRVGDRVCYVSGPLGAYADRRLIPASELMALPEGVDAETAAAVLLKGMTVEYLIERTHRVRRGEWVLWHAAAGGVGLIACQRLAHLGANCIGTVSTDAKANLALEHGLTHAIVYTRQNFVNEVRRLTGGAGVSVVYDSVGRATLTGSLDCLAPLGLLVSFGNASGRPEPVDPTLLAQKGSLFLTRPTLADYTRTLAQRKASADTVFEWVRDGVVRARVLQRFALSDAAEAHRLLEARETCGSCLLIPE